MDRFRDFARKVSHNSMRTAWVLKCDVRKFFASIDHNILKSIVKHSIYDTDAVWLLEQVIDSFHTEDRMGAGSPSSRLGRAGLPLGNLTSQLLANAYMNEFDQFMKRELRIRYYVRYADDFVVVHESRRYVTGLIPKIAKFLEVRLALSLHPGKVSVTTFASGVDFLGWVHFPHHRTLRTSTKRRMLKVLARRQTDATLASYLGLLSHGNTRKLIRKIVALHAK